MSRIDFETRKIALIGTGSPCRHFYMQYHAILDIKYYFATRIGKASPFVQDFFNNREGVRYVQWNESIVRDENLLLVLCVGHDARKRHDKMLFNMGFEWGTDYIDSLYVIQYYREKYDLQLEERNIWIFGAGDNGKRFYEAYKDIYTIKGFVSNNEEEKECQQLPVIRPAEIMRQSRSYVIICSKAEEAMSEQLEELGYRGDKDYTFVGMLPKKLFIAAGTCQIERIAGLLLSNPQFASYNICIYRDNMYAPCSEADNRRLKGYGIFCDIVFYNIVNAGTLEQRSYESLIKKFYPKAERIYMPFYYFRGQLMQATEAENHYTAMVCQQYLWLRGDKEVNGMIENGYTTEKIVEEVSRPDYWGKDEIRKHFERELKKIEVWDRFSSLPIKSYIEDNYRDMIVFCDGIHFNYALSLYLADEIARYLGLEPIRDTDILSRLEREEKRVMPVYPCVKEALGMNVEDSYQFHNGQESGEWETLDFKGYMEKYIQYVVSVRNISNIFGTIF